MYHMRGNEPKAPDHDFPTHHGQHTAGALFGIKPVLQPLETFKRMGCCRVHWPGKAVIKGSDTSVGQCIITLKVALAVKFAASALPAQWRSLPIDTLLNKINENRDAIRKLMPIALWINVDGGAGWTPSSPVADRRTLGIYSSSLTYSSCACNATQVGGRS